MNVLITGAGRGLGLGFVRHYLARGHQVWAAYRQDQQQLLEIDDANLHLLQWDVRQTKSPADLDLAGVPDELHLLINNAGVYGPKDDVGQSLDGVTAETMSQTFDINCIGPLRVVQSLLPRLRRGRASIANLSSKMGSSGDNSSGGCYAYRASKAGLVIVSKSMAVDLADDGCRVICLHPGWVKTDMTNHTGLIDVETSVAGMTRVIDNIDNYEAGAFIAFDGKTVPY